jgi:hypothetical protein
MLQKMIKQNRPGPKTENGRRKQHRGSQTNLCYMKVFGISRKHKRKMQSESIHDLQIIFIHET